MIPTKNKVFCLESRSKKLFFETESRANNFIKFNSAEQEELGYAPPVRSYYCTACGGWHVTSNPVAHTGPSKSERVIEKMKEARQTRREVENVYNEKIKEAKKGIAVVMSALPEDFEKTKAFCATCPDPTVQLEHIMAFRQRLEEIHTTMYLQRKQRKLIHQLKLVSKQFYYEVKNGMKNV